MQSSITYRGYNVEALRVLLQEKSRRLMFSGERDFVSEIEEIGGVLSRLDPPRSALLQAVDVKGQDSSTYYFAAFSDTHDLDRSLFVYRHARDLIRIIVLMDKYFEVGSERYYRMGHALISRYRKEKNEHLKSIVDFSLKQFWPFWKFEQYTRKLMLQGHVFVSDEVRYFNLFKSSDAPLIYAAALEALLPNFNRNTSLVLHYNQALQDIDDDLDDIREDLHDQMPNIFILASVGQDSTTSYSELHKHRMNGSRDSIIHRASETVLKIVDDYALSVEGITLPDQFMFLKYLSRHYSNRIRKKLAAASGQMQRLAEAQP